MNKKEELSKIIKFFKEYDRKDLEGCAYYKLGNGLYIVMAQSKEDDERGQNVAKIAYNCDDLQCDYDFDWYMPIFKNTGVVADTELTLSYTNYKNQASWFYNCYKGMIKELKKGNLLLGE